jgi:hypothetical protein
VFLQEFLRLGVKRRGCNGLAYTLNYAGEVQLPAVVLPSRTGWFCPVIDDWKGLLLSSFKMLIVLV